MRVKYINEEHEKRQIDDNESILCKRITIIFSLIIGILFQALFIWKSLGISSLIFNFILVLFGIIINRKNVNLNRKISYLFLIPLIVLCASFAIYNNEALRFLNILIIPLLISGYLISIRYENFNITNKINLKKIIRRLFRDTLSTIPKMPLFIKQSVNIKEKSEENAITKNIIKGIVISIPIVLVLILLLAGADMMFEYYLSNIGQVFENVKIEKAAGRLFIILIVSMYVFGMFWSFKYDDKFKVQNNIRRKQLEAVTVLTVIAVICIVYLIFSCIQFSYLYANGNGTLPGGISYADYARRGFFELILVTLINFKVITFTKKNTKYVSEKITRLCNIFYTVIIIFTYNMLFSSFYKLRLYEKAFGYTRLRIFVQVFIVLLAVLSLIILIGVWKEDFQVLKYSLLFTIIFYVGLNVMNVDKFIAKNNIERYKRTGKIDILYMEKLSYDSWSQVKRLLNADDLKIRKEIEDNFIEKRKRAREEYTHWYQYNYYKNKYLR